MSTACSERLQQLIKEFEGDVGPNKSADASNLVRVHYYSEFVPDELKDTSGQQRNIPIKGVIVQTQDGPILRSADTFMVGDDDSPMNHMIMTMGKVKGPENDTTVVCLRLHNDDMYSEMRPQVLSKMKPRVSSCHLASSPSFISVRQWNYPRCLTYLEVLY